MRLYNTYHLSAGSTLAKVKPDTNVKFCEAEKIREAFSNPHPKHLSLVHSLGTKALKNIWKQVFMMLNDSYVTIQPIYSSSAGVPLGPF